MKIDKVTFDSAKSRAALWQADIEKNREKAEKKFHEIMQKMLKNPINKIFLIELLDQSFRSGDSRRIANQLEYIFSKHENMDFFTEFEQLLIWLFRHIGVYLPDISVELFIKYLRNDISDIVIKGEESSLNKYLLKRSKEGTRVNINIIGEMVLGENEANERVKKYIATLKNPSIDYISIKISTIFSQITPLAHEWSVENISHKLQKVYTAAMENTFINNEGKKEHKFINLDMEEYRDINLTIDSFINVLSKDEFASLYAGIAMQAYLPDTLSNLKKLAEWAKKRVLNGGSPIKVRLVKGANQEMELTEASLRSWPCVTYLDKAQTDANFKILMDYLLSPEVAPYVHVGIASHNLFDHALGMLLARERTLEAYYSAEMLEGMSETAYHILKKEGLDVIMYAPIATKETFTNAIAYLVRRFDENTAEKNFLRHSFNLKVNSLAWDTLVKSYDDALALLPSLISKPYRTQDRNIEFQKEEIDTKRYKFKNESDTDFTLPQNIKWAEDIRKQYKNLSDIGGFHASPVIGSKEVLSQNIVHVIDKSQYHEKVVIGTYAKASEAQLQEAVSIAKADIDGWRKLDDSARQSILMSVADEFKKARGDLIGIAAAEVGKIFSETDVEVSEAIDFLNFYPFSVKKLYELGEIKTQPKGVGLVVSPWNFPIAIPAGGIAAALSAGNTVILKPSSDAVLCGYRLCQCFWDAGVSKNSLQFVPCDGITAGEHLIKNRDINFVIFTGSEATAYEMIKLRPDIHLSAETGGKNATIVTALADRDQAVKNVVASAFNNSGQKCSATSLLVLEREVYEDESFKRMLIDAASSLNVGSVWNFQNRVGALTSSASTKLKHALEHLDESEEWILKPSFADDNPYMLKPSIRLGTKRGDFCHLNELFAPMLSVMCADNLEDAINIVNETGYGLTSGIESLDEREQEIWKSKILAGNLYINRMTTGAIVQRQPFGGMRKSAIGGGKKAGGFNYVLQFMKLTLKNYEIKEKASHPYINKIKFIASEEKSFTSILEKVIDTIQNFAYWLNREFNAEHDYSNIRGESNIIRYLSLESVLLRFEQNDTLYEMLSSIAAAKMTGAKIHISVCADFSSKDLLWLIDKKSILLDENDTFAVEDEKTLIKSMQRVKRIRFLKPENVNKTIYESIADKALYIACEKFIEHGRVEMMHYFIEQSISNSYHRYGNLGVKGLKK